jgi:hypothetical protein
MMTHLQIVQTVVALFVAAAPWGVVRVVFLLAARHAQSVHVPSARPAAVRSLNRATVAGLLAAGSAGALLRPPALWMAALDWALFAVLSMAALRALRAIADAARPAVEDPESVRVASLQPRRVGDYVSAAWHSALFGTATLALAGFAWRLTSPGPDRRLLLPVTFAISAVVFAFLFEIWIRDLAAGGAPANVDSAARRSRKIGAVFAVEALLVLVYLALAHALLNLDWNLYAAWGAAGAVLGASAGVVGCALLVASQVTRRRYRTA